MTSHFEHFVRFAESRDDAAAVALYTWVTELAARDVPSPGGAALLRILPHDQPDLVHEVFVYLLRAGKASLILGSLARQNPWLHDVQADLMARGTADDKLLRSANRLLERYLRAMLGSRAIGKWRREGRMVPTEHAKLALRSGGGGMGERRPEVFDILEAVVESAASELPADRATGFRDAFEQVIQLAMGTVEMDGLVQAAIEQSEAVRGKDEREAYFNARNRLQQRHKRARDRGLQRIGQLEGEGTISPEEAEEVRIFVQQLLTRRQMAPSGSVPQGKPS